MGMRGSLPRDDLPREKRQEQLSVLDAFQTEQRVGEFSDLARLASTAAIRWRRTEKKSPFQFRH
jgi:hypothetical protein